MCSKGFFIMELPKAQFSYIRRFYESAISLGVSPGGLNQERADTLMRALAKTPSWLESNQDLHRLWMLGGDGWTDTIKALREYSSIVNKAKKASNKKSTQPNN
jgi:hypothetical protein